jgi:hypothetical protein
LKTALLEASGNLPDPAVIAQETDKMRNGEFPILGTGLHAELKSEEQKLNPKRRWSSSGKLL